MIIDVRTKEEYNEGHLNSAINIPVEHIEHSYVNAAEFDEHIIVYCVSGARAIMAKAILKQKGFTNVELYNGDGRYQK